MMKPHPYAEWWSEEPVWKGKTVGTKEVYFADEDKVEFVPFIIQRCVGYERSRPQCSVCAWPQGHSLHR